MHIKHLFSYYHMYYLSCFVISTSSSLVMHTSCVCESVFEYPIGSPCTMVRPLSFPLICVRFSTSTWWWLWKPLQASPHRLHPFQVPPETGRFYLTSHLKGARPLPAAHTHKHAQRYKYTDICTESAQRTCKHGPSECLLYGPQINSWNSVPPLFFRLYRTKFGTKSHFEFLFKNLKWQHCRYESVNLDLCADWTWKKLSGHGDSWKLAPQLNFSPVGSAQETLVGGDWKVNEQQLSQQHPPEDMTFCPGRSEGNSECVTVAVWRSSGHQQTYADTGRAMGPWILPSPSQHKRKRLAQKSTTWIWHCWDDLHQPYPALPSSINDYQVFFSVALKPCLYSSAALNSFPLWPLLNLSLSC